MSYTRRYSETVTGSYSETVSIDYPASETGGTKSKTISGTVRIPVNVNIHVDTDNFDNSVDNCRGSVEGLNAMVVATSLAEVKAKKESADKIGQSIIGGFFNYIRMELSQQSQEYSARCESLIIALSEQQAACINKSEQMEGDYNRISARYTNLFKDLDNELVSRIKTLDKPTFKVSNNLLSCTSRTTDTTLLGVATIASAESSRLESLLSATMIKHRAVELINKVNGFLKNTYNLKHSLNNMLSDNHNSGDIHIPILYLESVEKSAGVKSNIYGTTAKCLNRVKDINTAVEAKFKSKALHWSNMSYEQEDNINSYFNYEVSNSTLDPRVVQMMIKLKNSNTPKVLVK